jgi:hypothetical protein
MNFIPGFEGLYSVTKDGKVWRHEKETQVGTNGGFRKDHGKWLKQFHPNKKSLHLRVYLHKDGKTLPMLVHRAVALAYIPNPQQLPHINHIDGDQQNNCIENLEWCDASMNAKHAVMHGLTVMPDQSGENNSQAKLNASKVQDIRESHHNRESCASIARRYGLNPKTVWDIVNLKTWKNI